MTTSKSASAFITLLFFFFLSACVSQPVGSKYLGSDEFAEVDSYSSQKVKDAVATVADMRALFVFDIDNTLLQNPGLQFLGSAQWYDWQDDILAANDPRKLECLLKIQGTAYYMAHLVPTENGLSVSFLNEIQNAGHDVIALTARSPQFRYPTERELKRSGIDFKNALPRGFLGYPGYYFPQKSVDLTKPRNASYQNGIAMLAGQHKGAALIDLLDRIGAKDDYDYIVFFDDDSKNTTRMLDSFSTDVRNAVVFLYTAVDTDLAQYDLEKAVSGQNALLEAYKHFEQVPGCDIWPE